MEAQEPLYRSCYSCNSCNRRFSCKSCYNETNANVTKSHKHFSAAQNKIKPNHKPNHKPTASQIKPNQAKPKPNKAKSSQSQSQAKPSPQLPRRSERAARPDGTPGMGQGIPFRGSPREGKPQQQKGVFVANLLEFLGISRTPRSHLIRSRS